MERKYENRILTTPLSSFMKCNSSEIEKQRQAFREKNNIKYVDKKYFKKFKNK